ncbi:MAG: GNAT family N-acetyltransferase [Firmicutes bacterium]|nr:GNAT family N-acetyltransferase [Bacillota bacterium]
MMNEFPVDCRPLTVENLDDLLNFMETDAFSDNPRWRGCYCVFHYLSDERDGDWTIRSCSDNRTALTRMVEDKRGHWIVAYGEGRIVGWVNADIGTRLKRYDEWGVRVDPATGIVACFVVDPRLRLRGIARQLLNAAVEALWASGVKNVDAYVTTDPKALSESEKELGPDQLAHHGPLAMYLKVGFGVIEQKGAMSHVRLKTPANRDSGE